MIVFARVEMVRVGQIKVIGKATITSVAASMIGSKGISITKNRQTFALKSQ